MTKQLCLPNEIWADILTYFVHDQYRLCYCLDLRFVNKFFDSEILRILIEDGLFDKLRPRRRQITSYDFGLKVFFMSLRGTLASPKHCSESRAVLTKAFQHLKPDDQQALDLRSVLSRLWFRPSRTSSVRPPHGKTLRITLLYTITMLMAASSTSDEEKIDFFELALSLNDDASKASATMLFNAMMQLVGLNATVVLLATNGDAKSIHIDGQADRLLDKSSGFFALITFVNQNNIVDTKFFLDMCNPNLNNKVKQKSMPLKVEEDWYETVSACLFVSFNFPDRLIFDHCIKQVICSHRFCSIDFNHEDLLLRVSKACAYSPLREMIRRGWHVVNHETEAKLARYGYAVDKVSKMSRNTSGRAETLEALIMASDVWQSDRLLRSLLWRVATDNQIELARLMLARLKPRRTPHVHDVNWPDYDHNPLKTAISRQNKKMFRFLVEHRDAFVKVVGDVHYMDPQHTIMQLVNGDHTIPEYYFKELLHAFPDREWGRETFSHHANTFSDDFFHLFARNVDLHQVYSKYDTRKNPNTVGGWALSKVVERFQVDRVRLLLSDEFQVRDIAKPHDIEFEGDNEDFMQTVTEIRDLLTSHGIVAKITQVYRISYGHSESDQSDEESEALSDAHTTGDETDQDQHDTTSDHHDDEESHNDIFLAFGNGDGVFSGLFD